MYKLLVVAYFVGSNSSSMTSQILEFKTKDQADAAAENIRKTQRSSWNTPNYEITKLYTSN